MAGAQDSDQLCKIVAEHLFGKVTALALAVLEQFAQNQTRDFAMFEHAGELFAGEVGQAFRQRPGLDEQFLQVLRGIAAGNAQDRQIERLLGAEVVKYVRLADVGAFGDGIHGDGIETVLGEQCLGRREDARRGVADRTCWGACRRA